MAVEKDKILGLIVMQRKYLSSAMTHITPFILLSLQPIYN